MSPKIGCSTQVSTRSTRLFGVDVADEFIRLARRRLLRRTPRDDLVGDSSIVRDFTVALLAAAPRKNPHGVAQICNCCGHAAWPA